ncbi:MAG TPA: LysM domain-containing protein [Opitutaceae bacterium]|nr:LysM domain-containing protein [Opitutaceae bacterium]
MKILKIFGVVVGIHLFALIVIFANPGCSSTTKPPPAPVDTVAKNDTAPITVPMAQGDAANSPMSSAPIAFNPDAPATAAGGSGGGVRYVPTRPGTPAASTLLTQPVADVTPVKETYTVKSGDSLWSLANKNHIKVADLAAVNNLKTGTVLQPGQKLIIPGKTPSAPAASPSAATPATSAAPAATAKEEVKHTVKSGESLSTIAKTYGVKQGDIAVRNNISDPAKIRAGDVLVIPGWQATGAGKKSDAAKSSGAKTAPNPVPNILDSSASAPPAPATSEPPVIKVDDNPMSPAPKN